MPKSYIECPTCYATHLLVVRERPDDTTALYMCSHCSTEFWVEFNIKEIEIVKD